MPRCLPTRKRKQHVDRNFEMFGNIIAAGRTWPKMAQAPCNKYGIHAPKASANKERSLRAFMNALFGNYLNIKSSPKPPSTYPTCSTDEGCTDINSPTPHHGDYRAICVPPRRPRTRPRLRARIGRIRPVGRKGWVLVGIIYPRFSIYYIYFLASNKNVSK